jgi:hypothetical protein
LSNSKCNKSNNNKNNPLCVNDWKVQEVLDEYAMLALPGIPVEKSTERSWTSTTRTANHNILREICLGRLSGEEAKGCCSCG